MQLIKQANLEGIVPACRSCLQNSDSNTISLWISNFPSVRDDDFSSVKVTFSSKFGDLICNGWTLDGRLCHVRSVGTLVDAKTGVPDLYITVSVPSAPGGVAGPCTILVSMFVKND